MARPPRRAPSRVLALAPVRGGVVLPAALIPTDFMAQALRRVMLAGMAAAETPCTRAARVIPRRLPGIPLGETSSSYVTQRRPLELD